jgi:hypothetical protein
VLRSSSRNVSSSGGPPGYRHGSGIQVEHVGTFVGCSNKQQLVDVIYIKMPAAAAAGTGKYMNNDQYLVQLCH